MLNRFETILGLAEMVNLNRATEDDDEESAAQGRRGPGRDRARASTSAAQRPG